MGSRNRFPLASDPGPTRPALCEEDGATRTGRRFTLGALGLDARLGGGLASAALHEVCPLVGGDAATTGFGLGLALRAGGQAPIAWVHHDALDHAAGRPDGTGLRELGGDPARLVLTRLRRVEDVLQAALEAARCPGLGALLVQVRGEPRQLDLTATRRLTLAAAGSGVTVILARAAPGPSAAVTRWGVASAPSTPLGAGAPGHPAVHVSLLRHRNGPPGGPWRLEWSRDRQSFADGAPLSGALVPVPADRPAAADRGPERRAG